MLLKAAGLLKHMWLISEHQELKGSLKTDDKRMITSVNIVICMK